MHARTHRAALAGLGMAILLLASFGIWSAVRTNAAAKRAASAVRWSDVYQQARFAVGQEESLERKYRLEPSPAVRHRYSQAVAALESSLETVARGDVGAAHRASARHLLAVHAQYLESIDWMFAEVDAGDPEGALALDAQQVDPRFDVIESTVNTAAREHHRAALQSLSDLRVTESGVEIASSVVFVVGLALLVFFSVLLTRVNERLRRQAAASEHDALHDALTGLPNRALLVDRLEHAVRAATRAAEPFSLMMIDLDRFKEINDTFGHTTGDLLLREIGPRVERALRPGDTIARLGGDEFALILPSSGIDDARDVAERVLASLRRPFVLPDLSLSVDASIGIVTHPVHGRDVETLLQHADVAMYLAKDHRRGKALYDPAQDPHDPSRLTLANDLRRALSDEEFELHYQPTFMTETLEPVCVEALVRWRHPERGLLSPLEFIPLAEHNGLIVPLTRLVLGVAMQQSAAWLAAGIDLPVAVNLSVANLLDLEAVDDIARILERKAVDPSRLRLEVTESTVMADPERARSILGKLAEMGVRISVDDFGTGHSSLTYLRHLPVDELKIDKSFVRHLAVDEDDAAIIRSTVELGHRLGLRVVAEGVEDARSLELLRDIGCDLVQGFHLCRPLPAADLTERLSRRERV